MSEADVQLQKMVRGFRVTDLQSLLVYAGRNKGGKKNELQNRALDLIKLHSDSINLKIRELHANRFTQSRGQVDPSAEVFPLGTINDPMGSNYAGPATHKSPLGLGMGIPSYGMPSMNRSMIPPMPDLNIPQYPVNPDVTFKDLPFYDVLSELLKPTSLVPYRGDGLLQEKEFIFYFRPQDIRELDSNTDVQVQLRIGCLENNREQEDEFPSSICLKVNHKVATLPNAIPTNKPGQDPKRPKRPLDITNIVRRSTTEPQVVCISWASNNNKPYVMGVFLVRRQTSSVLIKRLKDIGVRNPDHTTAMIKEKLCHDRDSEIATMSLRGSLICPLGKTKMMLPCRALTCTHLQCFDAPLYVQMNEKKPKWICPVCDKSAEFKNLAIDGLFLDITRKAPSECTEVQFHENGSWTPVIPVKKAPVIPQTLPDTPKVEKTKKVEVIDLDSGSDTEDSWPTVQPPKKKPYKPTGVISPITIPEPTPPRSSEVGKPYDVNLQPSCSSKSVAPPPHSPSVWERNTSTPSANQGFGSPLLPPAPSASFILSAETPSAPPPPTGSFQDPVELNNSSSSAGQCSYDFDLYSLINTNNADETYSYDDNANSALPIDDTPDVINID